MRLQRGALGASGVMKGCGMGGEWTLWTGRSEIGGLDAVRRGVASPPSGSIA